MVLHENASFEVFIRGGFELGTSGDVCIICFILTRAADGLGLLISSLLRTFGIDLNVNGFTLMNAGNFHIDLVLGVTHR